LARSGSADRRVARFLEFSRAPWTLFIEAPVDLCDLGDPTLALGVLERQDFFVRPVKVIRNIRYLLIEPL